MCCCASFPIRFGQNEVRIECFDDLLVANGHRKVIDGRIITC